MSINSAMNAGVSGLVSNASSLAAISDNIANVNTTAYKRKSVNFSNVVTSQSESGLYNAGGVHSSVHQYVAQQGTTQSTNSTTDLAILGSGMFVVADKGGDISESDPRFFTRAGSFSVNGDGYLVNSQGQFLQAWIADINGEITPDPSNLAIMKPINVSNLGASVLPTTEITLNANFDKRAILGSAGDAAYDATATSMTAYAADNTTGTKPDFKFDVAIVDSTGGTRSLTFALLKDSTSGETNQWHAEIYAKPATDLDGTNPAGQILAGTLKFNSDGSFNQDLSTLYGTTTNQGITKGNKPHISIGSSEELQGIRWAFGLGIYGSAIDVNMTSVTQLSADNFVKTNANGATVGNLAAIKVEANGFVQGVFDNSLVRTIAQIGLASVTNPDGLKGTIKGAYEATSASGDVSIGIPGKAGIGQVSSSTLETSTVDLSVEFAGLITTPRAYSASSKIITTADQMLEELLSIKR